MPFLVQSTLTLEFLGEGWENCYIKLSPLSYNDQLKLAEARKDRDLILAGDQEALKKVSNYLVELIKGKFIEGKGWNGKEVVDLKAEEIFEIPGDVVERLVQLFDKNPITPKKKN